MGVGHTCNGRSSCASSTGSALTPQDAVPILEVSTWGGDATWSLLNNLNHQHSTRIVHLWVPGPPTHGHSSSRCRGAHSRLAMCCLQPNLLSLLQVGRHCGCTASQAAWLQSHIDANWLDAPVLIANPPHPQHTTRHQPRSESASCSHLALGNTSCHCYVLLKHRPTSCSDSRPMVNPGQTSLHRVNHNQVGRHHP